MTDTDERHQTGTTDAPDEPRYMSGFGNEFASEAVPGALPVGQNNPQRPPLGLYTEQLSGTAFTVPNARNRRTWFYRIRPAVRHAWRFTETDRFLIRTAPCREDDPPIGQLRWDPPPFPDGPTDFVTGIRTIATNGDAHTQTGMAAHIYLATESMSSTYFYDADGELLIVPQEGRLRFFTECGILVAGPREIVVIPRGMIFRVELVDERARGYICEDYAPISSCPSGARSAPTAWPIRATSFTRWPTSRTWRCPVSCSSSSTAACSR